MTDNYTESDQFRNSGDESIRAFPGRRREKWLLVADRLKISRAIVVACACFYNANYSPRDVAETFGISESDAVIIAKAVLPWVRKRRIRGL